jgi:hypothetical protein
MGICDVLRRDGPLCGDIKHAPSCLSYKLRGTVSRLMYEDGLLVMGDFHFQLIQCMYKIL